MQKDKLKILSEYIKSGISPILVENISLLEFEDTVIIEGDCGKELLNGHYEEINFVAPNWYNELIKKNTPILVINEINKVSTEEQIKFGEILKYKKVSTFKLPENCITIVTYSNLKENPINESIYSLLAQI